MELQLAVDEACANVVHHAYSDQGGRLELTIEAMNDEIHVILRDWGRPFDPQAVPVPDTSAPLATISLRSSRTKPRVTLL